MSSIGQNIKTLRAQFDLTQIELAAKAQISQGQLSEYENDHVRPTMENLGKLADVFGCSVAVLDESLRSVPGVHIEGDFNQSGNGNYLHGLRVNNAGGGTVNIYKAAAGDFKNRAITGIIHLDIDPVAKNIVLKFLSNMEIEKNSKED